MANQEHLAKLKAGVEAWNKWREENPEIIPNLSFAYLDHANLESANLESVNFEDTVGESNPIVIFRNTKKEN